MSIILRERVIKRTKKIHICNACIWLKECALHEINFTFSEYRSIVKAKQNNWKIPIGGTCLYSVGIYENDFFSCYSIPEIHQICIKYEIYQDD